MLTLTYNLLIGRTKIPKYSSTKVNTNKQWLLHNHHREGSPSTSMSIMSWMLINRLTKCLHAYRWHDWWCYVRDMYNENCITLGESIIKYMWLLVQVRYNWMFYLGTGPVFVAFFAVSFLTHWETWDPVYLGFKKCMQCICRRRMIPTPRFVLILFSGDKIFYHNCEIESLQLAMICYRTCNLMASFSLKWLSHDYIAKCEQTVYSSLKICICPEVVGQNAMKR